MFICTDTLYARRLLPEPNSPHARLQLPIAEVSMYDQITNGEGIILAAGFHLDCQWSMLPIFDERERPIMCAACCPQLAFTSLASISRLAWHHPPGELGEDENFIAHQFL